jgi:DNA-binding NtrC family response regulator
MSEWILVVDSDNQSCLTLLDLLRTHNYHAVCSPTLSDLESVLRQTGCRAVIFDLDKVSPDNRLLRDLKKRHTGLHLMALSTRSFHPELKESMTDCIYACLSKPVDPEELIYWLKTIFENAEPEFTLEQQVSD